MNLLLYHLEMAKIDYKYSPYSYLKTIINNA